jgi:hypothetical protein
VDGLDFETTQRRGMKFIERCEITKGRRGTRIYYVQSTD